MTTDVLFTLKLGRGRALAVYAGERSTLAGGRPRTVSGTDTVYTVRACANRSSRPNGAVLGTFPTLDGAREFVESAARDRRIVSALLA